MECHICEVRSSVGYCVECHQLLCETCGVPCDQCRKMSCPTHIHETKSGKALCAGCYAERRAKKEAVKAEFVQRQAHHQRDDAIDTSFHGIDSPAEDAGEVSDVALVASARRAVEPWKISLYLACGGVAFGVFLLIFSSFRHIVFGTHTYPTGVLLFVFVVLSGFWTWVGLRNEEFFKDRTKCFYGAGANVLCLIIAVFAVTSTPQISTKPIITNVPIRTGSESSDELKQWRERALRKYERPQ